MACTSSDSFVIEFKLKTSSADKIYLQECFSAGWKIYNTLVRHCRKQLASLRQDKTYRNLLAKYHSLKGSRNQKTVTQQLSAMTASFGLTEYSLHSFVKVQQKRYKQYINSHVAQKIASAVWRGVEKVLPADSGRDSATETQPWQRPRRPGYRNFHGGSRDRTGMYPYSVGRNCRKHRKRTAPPAPENGPVPPDHKPSEL